MEKAFANFTVLFFGNRDMINNNIQSSNGKYLFGPVPSRRFGRSLGIDMVPFKTCSFNCLFCEVGKTNCHTLQRAEYVPVADVINEFDNWLESGGYADVVTVAGSGEPTLHLHFGDVIDAVRDHSNIKTVLLTNSSLLHIEDVRNQAARADIAKVSLSAWNQESFQKVNKPHKSLLFSDVVAGIKDFREIYKEEMRLEVVVLPGINSQPDDMAKIAEIAKSFAPDSIELNTVVRPPAFSSVSQASATQLLSLAPLFTPVAHVIAGFDKSKMSAISVGSDELVAMLARRPCTEKDIAQTFSISKLQVNKLIRDLCESGLIKPKVQNNEIYYVT